MAASKPGPKLPLFRVHYRYADGDTTRPRQFSVLVNAATADAAEAAVLKTMIRDGMNVQRINFTGAIQQ